VSASSVSQIIPKKVAIIGGGLAGLAAGCALADSGFQIALFERRPYLGGRASSYQHPGTGEVVDNCQHVLLGCCTNLIQFYERLGVEDKIRWYDQLTFLEPGGRASVLRPSSLPAPFHSTPSFLGVACLGLADKLSIASAMAVLALKQPADNGKSFLTWLRQHHQTDRGIERFWKTILVSALNEDLDRISIPYGAQVIRESFLKSPAAGRMGIPTVPLTELYSVAGEYIKARGGEIKLRASVDGIQAASAGVTVLSANEKLNFDYVISAVPFDVLAKILPQSSAADPLRQSLAKFDTSPITGIHLWFDRPITDLDHAVLLDRTIQWMFHKSKLLGKSLENNGSYIELVVSASKSLVEKSKQEIIDIALKEVQEFFPKALGAKLMKSTVIKEVHATYSAQPGADDYRPRSKTEIPGLFLAGDWTATGWPATMEGAVRSGYLAAEAVVRELKVDELKTAESNFTVPDLAPTGFM